YSILLTPPHPRATLFPYTTLFRSHGRDWRLHLPWGWNTGEIGIPETANFHPDPAELRDPAIEPICRKYLELRYRLMPYLYSADKDRKSTRLNSSHLGISYAVFCLK